MRHRRLFAFLCIASAELSSPKPGRPQSDAAVLKFDAASVKPDKDATPGSVVRTPGALIIANTEFTRLLEMALETRQLDISQVSGSLRTERFDITAKSAAKITGDQHWVMLRALLEERFRLTFHKEERPGQFYALELANTSKGLGPKLARSTDADCPVNPTESNFCGLNGGVGRLIGRRVTMARIAQELSAFADHPVRDATALDGWFDFQLAWTPDRMRSADGGIRLLNGIPIDTGGPSLYTAIQEQLGVRLESRKGEIETIVIDHAEEPSPN
jgi:uncharacterized protein (TIGR03435 family)